MGVAYYSLEKREESVSCHTRALEICPKLAEAHLALGTSCLNSGQDKKAIEHFTTYVSLNRPYLAEYVAYARRVLAMLQE